MSFHILSQWGHVISVLQLTTFYWASTVVLALELEKWAQIIYFFPLFTLRSYKWTLSSHLAHPDFSTVILVYA